jgi:hypothetical protein
MAKMNAHRKRMRAGMYAWRKEMTAYQEATEAILSADGVRSGA